jgi:hypothetical protein
MNKSEIQEIKRIQKKFHKETGSRNQWRLAWVILDKHPMLAVSIIVDRLREIAREGKEER